MISEQELQKQYRTAVIVAAALIQGCVIFGGIVYYLIVNGKAPAVEDIGFLRGLAVIGGIGGLLASFQWKKFQLEPAAGAERPVGIAPQRIMTTMLVSMALVEGAVMFGIVVALLSRNLSDLAVPFLIAAIGFSAHFPRYHDWERWSMNR